MKKPLIGITNGMGLAISSMNMEHPPINQHRLNDSYVQAVIRAGGIPVILPPCEDASLMEAMVDGVDGVILSGGGDLDPALFGQRPTGKLGGVSPRRDAAELAVADYVLNKTEKPLLGICRGVQVLNVALGGSLHIDLPDAGKLDHALYMYPRNVTSHEVAVEENTRLSQILGGGVHKVNSFHHQAVDEPGRGLTVTARSVPDGVIEAVYLPGKRFVWGVQWHPESVWTISEENRKIAEAFLRATR